MFSSGVEHREYEASDIDQKNYFKKEICSLFTDNKEFKILNESDIKEKLNEINKEYEYLENLQEYKKQENFNKQILIKDLNLNNEININAVNNEEKYIIENTYRDSDEINNSAEREIEEDTEFKKKVFFKKYDYYVSKDGINFYILRLIHYY